MKVATTSDKNSEPELEEVFEAIKKVGEKCTCAEKVIGTGMYIWPSRAGNPCPVHGDPELPDLGTLTILA